MNSNGRSHRGEVGEAAALKKLEAHGWTVTDLNASRRNEPNVDLAARKGDRIIYIQVKAFNDYGWASGGGVTPDVCAGGPLFNKAKNAQFRCDFVICPTPASPGDKRETRTDWRFFVMQWRLRTDYSASISTPTSILPRLTDRRGRNAGHVRTG